MATWGSSRVDTYSFFLLWGFWTLAASQNAGGCADSCIGSAISAAGCDGDRALFCDSVKAAASFYYFKLDSSRDDTFSGAAAGADAYLNTDDVPPKPPSINQLSSNVYYNSSCGFNADPASIPNIHTNSLQRWIFSSSQSWHCNRISCHAWDSSNARIHCNTSAQEESKWRTCRYHSRDIPELGPGLTTELPVEEKPGELDNEQERKWVMRKPIQLHELS
ncbi:hypothetical protein DL95DRAFT_462992 [Leptodontidium sp. 2 PMI_412]|nr:hypothetical protein DL95DRAFT_462992 [Leptodontidium sp. 2 PMI_412]